MLLWPASAALAAECEADVRGSLSREEPEREITRLVFKVDVSTTTDCGEVHFNVILEIREDDGKTVKKKLPGLVKLHDGQISEKVNHLRSRTCFATALDVASADTSLSKGSAMTLVSPRRSGCLSRS
jgi:hypothetical protein